MAQFKHLQALLSEQNNYKNYREWLKLRNDRRPMIPYLGLYIHDITYLTVLSKKENANSFYETKINELLNQIEFFQDGPKYSYSYLIGVLLAASGMSKKEEQVSKANDAILIEKKLSYGLSNNCCEELKQFLKDFDHEQLGEFVSHWILSRNWYTEKEMDHLSMEREPRVNNHSQEIIVERESLFKPKVTNDLDGDGQFSAAIEYLLKHDLTLPPQIFSTLNDETSSFSSGGNSKKRHFSFFDAIKGTATAISSVTRRSADKNERNLPTSPLSKIRRRSSSFGESLKHSSKISLVSLSDKESRISESSKCSLDSFNMGSDHLDDLSNLDSESKTDSKDSPYSSRSPDSRKSKGHSFYTGLKSFRNRATRNLIPDEKEERKVEPIDKHLDSPRIKSFSGNNENTNKIPSIRAIFHSSNSSEHSSFNQLSVQSHEGKFAESNVANIENSETSLKKTKEKGTRRPPPPIPTSVPSNRIRNSPTNESVESNSKSMQNSNSLEFAFRNRNRVSDHSIKAPEVGESKRKDSLNNSPKNLPSEGERL